MAVGDGFRRFVFVESEGAVVPVEFNDFNPAMMAAVEQD